MKKSLKVLALAGLLSLNTGCVQSLYNYYVRQNEQFEKEGYYVDKKAWQLAGEYNSKKENKNREIGKITTYHTLESGIFTLYPDLNSISLTIENPNNVDYETLVAYLNSTCRSYTFCYSEEMGYKNLEWRIFDYSTDFQRKWGVANDTIYIQRNNNRIIVNGSKIMKSRFGLKELIGKVKSVLDIPFSKEAEQVYDELK
ncbi:hypothetical protein HYX19_00035 [Candidatus Woesearchaeota archaeon]|nr:hypothetical protein [Candidatus Woesearchaeota archaeon]